MYALKVRLDYRIFASHESRAHMYVCMYTSKVMLDYRTFVDITLILHTCVCTAAFVCCHRTDADLIEYVNLYVHMGRLCAYGVPGITLILHTYVCMYVCLRGEL